MTEESIADPFELFYEEEIYFPFEVQTEVAAKAPEKKQPATAPDKENAPLKLASVFHQSTDRNEQRFYEKILQAIGRLRSGTAETEMLKPELEALIQYALEQKAGGLIIWGYAPSDFGLQGDRYQIIQRNEIKLLFSHSLREVENDRSSALKRKLWSVIREQFQA